MKTIYGTLDLDEAMALLARYQVEYVYLGPIERMYYRGPGLEKFESAAARGLTEVFRNASVRIYRVGDGARLSSATVRILTALTFTAPTPVGSRSTPSASPRRW